MLHDPTHLFRRMWAAEEYGKMSQGPACWNRKRDQSTVEQDSHTYFADVASGRHCQTNWFEGNGGSLGIAERLPTFSGSGAALLGFDDTIDRVCHKGEGCRWHAECCVKRSYNILSLYGQRVPYNICRNLEWQACAAKGLLPGQKDSQIVFAIEPSSVTPDGSNGRQLGVCGGWTPAKKPTGGAYGYATEDIFYLEICLFHHICRNGEELFQLRAGDVFVCDFSHEALGELEIMLSQTPRPADPPDPQACVLKSTCDADGHCTCNDVTCECFWANERTCRGDDGSPCNRCCCMQYRGG